MRSARPFFTISLAGALLAVSAVWADGGGGSSEPGDAKSSPDWTTAIAAINDKRWSAAIVSLRRFVAANAADADGHNYLAYAYRNSGKLDDAFRHYRRALALDPRHLGAHEYIGEAYLQAGQPEEARKHLKRLADLCSSSCEQYRDLQEALAAYDAKVTRK